MLLIVFALSMFLSAALLFLVEPMLAKMALPLLGGTAAVWNTCLVFFQAGLLAGYLYAHAAIKWLGRRTQIALHIAIAVTPLAVLPLHIPAGWVPPTQSSPILWMLAMLSVAVGLPFFVLSSSTPILQKWFAYSGHKSSGDPYFLYAASNAGSLIGLLGYPFLLEPTLRLSAQSRLWSCGYLVFLAMTLTCGTLVWRMESGRLPTHVSSSAEDSHPEDTGRTEPVLTFRQKIRWVALAFVPSSLMMGVTTALTTDVPPVPLLWVLPLSLYLLSFVLVFSGKRFISHEWLVRRLPFLILLALFPTLGKYQMPFPALVLVYLSALFAIALVCHGELARTRPRVGQLTEFYLWISVGGVLGGIFNALIAPVIFSSVIEFPLAMIFAACLRPPIDQKATSPEKTARAKIYDVILPVALGLITAAVITALKQYAIPFSPPVLILLFGYSMLWCMSFGKRPLRFAAGLVALTVACSLYTGPYGRTLHSARSFFGVLRVINSPDNRFRYLIHGAIVHGVQSLEGARSRDPLAYYAASGPAGSILRAMKARDFPSRPGRKPNWAVVGLGAGAMACYFEPGESLTFYEIDPLVRSIALDPDYFTFLEQCAPSAQIVLGDARLQLAGVPDGSYDLLVLDAFSGDTIPMHLISREALALYLRKLAPGGMLAFHISNNHLRLAPTFCVLARDAGLQCLLDDDTNVTHEQSDRGKFPSQWLVMARSRSDLAGLATDARWAPVNVQPGTDLWTDDYSNLLRIIKWR